MRRTTVGLPSRPSNAPSMHRPSTSDRRLSGMPSGGGNRRTSTMSSISRAASSTSRRSTMTNRKVDPRQLSDKGLIEQSVNDICAFLHERGFEHGITPKQLKSPTTKDFQNVFAFLVSQIVPFTWTPGKHLEQEVTTVLRALNYPFSVSKSALSAVGSSHTWPNLLGVLTWIMDMAKCSEMSYATSESNGRSKGDERLNILQDHVATGYSKFLDGDDEMKEQEAEMEAKFQERSEKMLAEIESMSEMVKEREAYLDKLRKEASPLDKVVKRRRHLEDNVSKFNVLIPSMLNHRQVVLKGLETKNDDVRQLTNELESLTLEKNRDMEVIDTQRSQSIDASEIAQKRAEIRRALENAEEEKSIVEEGCAQARASMGRVQAEVELLMKSYKQSLVQIGPDAGGLDLQLNMGGSDGDLIPGLEAATSALRTLRENVDKELIACGEGIQRREYEADELEDKAKFEKQRVEEMRGQLKRHERDFEKEREEADALHRERATLLEARKNETAERRAAAEAQVKAYEEQHELVKARCRELRTALDEEVRATIEQVVGDIRKLRASKKAMRRTIDAFERHVEGGTSTSTRTSAGAGGR